MQFFPILEESISRDDLEDFFQKKVSSRIKETLSMKFLFPKNCLKKSYLHIQKMTGKK